MNNYKTPGAFKQALKTRVMARARQSGRPFNRMLQIALFERFLARVYAGLGDAVILSGMMPSDGLPWKTLGDLHLLCANFLNPLLDGSLSDAHRWNPQQKIWEEKSSG